MPQNTYILYPEAEAQLDASGIVERVRDRLGSFSLEKFTIANASEAKERLSQLAGQGCFKNAPKDLKDTYSKQIDAFISYREKNQWIIKKPNATAKKESTWNDFFILSGYFASLIIHREEFWDYKKFGFATHSEFLGTVGAYVKGIGTPNEGYTWSINCPDGRRFQSEITGDELGNVQIHRVNATPYETTDPFGNRVFYRPELSIDRATLLARHSTESDLLVALLKYLEQENIPSQILKNKSSRFLKEIKEWHRLTRKHALRMLDTKDLPASRYLIFQEDLPRLNAHFVANQPTFYRLPALNGRADYGIYIGPEEDLIFTYEPHKKNSAEKTPVLQIYSDEVDTLLFGIFQQAAYGKLRTPLRHLENLLRYRFSRRFISDQSNLQIKN